MRTRNKQINLDRANGAAENASKEEETMRNSSKKTPWYLRFAPEAILRKSGLAVLAIAAALTPIQTKAAIFTIDVITSWMIGEGLTAGKNALLAANGGTNKAPLARLSPTAKAVANTAYWLSNSFEQITKEDEWDFANQRWTGNWTTTTETASQLRQDNNESLSGRFANGKAMTQAQAKWYLYHSKVSYKWHKFEVFYTEDDIYVDDYWVYARADAIEKEKAKFLKRLAITKCEAVYAGHAFEQQTTTYNVDSYEMESKFENVTGHAALSQKARSSAANNYEGTVYWTYNKVNEDGTTQVNGKPDHRKYDFKSYEPDTDWVEDLCKNNQSLSVAPDINNSARRRFENQRYKVRKYGPIPLYYRIGITRPIHRIGWYWEHRMKRGVVQEED